MNEKNEEYSWILFFIVLLFLFSFYLNSPTEIVRGLYDIFLEKKLVTDYFSITTLGATIFNASLIMLFNLYLVFYYRLKLNGFIIAGLFMGLAFGFTGKNILAIFPFYIGIYLYSLYMKRPFKSMVPLAMLSTSLAPIVSVLGFYGVLLAIITGFFMPMITKFSIVYHGGYNLYNSGFAAGLFAILMYSILRAFNIDIYNNINKYNQFEDKIFIFFLTLFSIMMLVGLIRAKDFSKNLKSLYSHTGRLVTDFVSNEGFFVSLFNMGSLGALCLFIAKIYNSLDGMVLCAILTVVSFGGFGKHLKNSIPIMLGIFIARYIFLTDVEVSTYLSIMFFSTCLAPIAGKYGTLAGIIVGISHYVISIRISPIYGGLNLYNNGFAAGLVASIAIPIIQELKGAFDERREEKNNKNDR